MTITVPWAYVEAAIFVGCCIAAGAVLGLVRAEIGIRMEGRRG